MAEAPPLASAVGAWSRARRLGFLAVVVLVTIAAYGPIFGASFVYDDHLVVLGNPAVTRFDLGDLIARPIWSFSGSESEPGVGYWRPATSLLLAATYALAGPEPLAFHVLALVLHIAATCAAWALARRITKSDGVGFAVALLFALHPVHVESVAWISALGDPAFGLCVLLALERHLAWREAGSRGKPWAAGALLLAGLAAKELAAGGIVAILALDLSLKHTSQWRRAYAPYFFAVLIYVAARMLVFESRYAGFDLTTTDFGVPVSRLLLLRAEILGLGLRYSAWPTDLRLFHPFVPDASEAALALPLALLAGWVVVTAWLAWRRERVLLAASLLVLAPIAVIVLRVGALSTFPFSERYLYLAVFGVALFAVVLAKRALPTAALVALLLATASLLGFGTHAQAKTWTDDSTLFRMAVERSPRVPYARWVLGRDLLEKYRATGDFEALRHAEHEFQESLALLESAQRGDGSILGLTNDHVQANLGLGWVLLYITEAEGTHDFAPAESLFRLVTERYPKSEEAWTGLGVARMELGDFAGSAKAFERALAVNGRFVEAHRNFGRLHSRMGDWPAARASFEAALAAKPEDVDTLLLLGGTLERLGDDAGARARFDRAVRNAPRDARPRVQLANLTAKAGRLAQALVEVDAALALDAQDAEGHLTRGKILVALGEKHGALASFERACDLAPNSYEAHRNAGALSLELHDAQRAMPLLLRAYENRPAGDSGREIQATIRSLSMASPQAFLQLATTDADRGDSASALAWLADLLSLDPNHGPALFLQGAMLRKQGDDVGARVAWEKALTRMPESFPLLESLGSLMVDLGDKAAARKYLEKALEVLEKTARGSSDFDQPLDLLRGRVARLREQQ